MVEYNPFIDMVIHLEGKKQKMSRQITNPMQKVKENCINTLYFWSKEEGIREVELLVDFVGYF